MALVARPWHAGPRAPLEGVRPSLRPRAHAPLRQTDLELGAPPRPSSRAGRSVDGASSRCLHGTGPGPRLRPGSPVAVGAPTPAAAVDALSGASGLFCTAARIGHAGKPAKTLRPLPRTAQRTALGPCASASDAQEDRVSMLPVRSVTHRDRQLYGLACPCGCHTRRGK